MRKFRQIKNPLFRIMKISFIQLAWICICSSIAFAHDSYSQELLNKTISLNVENVEVKKVLGSIEKAADVKFVYSSKAIQANRKISIQASNQKLSAILDLILKPLKISYRVFDEQIILNTKILETPKSIETREILPNVEMADRPVRGKVTDESGTALPGVSIIVKGTSKGTSTDAAGMYSLGVPDEKSVLVFSYVGYKPSEITVGNLSVLDAVLAVDEKTLNEVVVIGYGTAKKSDLTGAISSISAKDYEDQPIIRADQILQGRAPGVQVINGVGGPGGNVKIRIRGANSIQGDNNPLYVIDGYVGGDLFDLNPDDIENMQVLKDASSTAIYGSRGANGVVLITTKKGSNRKAVINVGVNYASSEIIKRWDLLGAAEFAEIANQRSLAVGATPSFSQTQIDEFRRTGGTNWQNEVLRKAPLKEYNFGISGGTGKTTYMVSFNHLNQEGIVLGSSLKRFNLRANLNTQVNDRVSFRLNIAATRRNNYNANDNKSAPLRQALIWAPTTRVRDTNGNIVRNDPTSSISVNPVALALDLKEYNFSTIGNLTGGINFKILEGLTFDAGLATNYSVNQYNEFRDVTIGGGTASAFRSFGEGFSFQNTNNLTYTKKFGESHALTATAVYELFSYKTTGFNAGGSALIFPGLGYDNISLASTITAATGYSNNGLESFLGRVNYAYKDKYLLTASLRRDGSSKFQGDNKYSTFPSLGLAWKLSEESFMKEIAVIKSLKLRASYGKTGSQAIGSYATLSSFKSDTYSATASFNNTSLTAGIVQGNPANLALKWETTSQFDIGADVELGFANMQIGLDYFIKNTKDLLLNDNLPDYIGGGVITRNIGEVQNKGIEFYLNSTPVSRPKFTWNSDFNFSVLNNKVVALGSVDTLFTGSNVGGGLATQSEFVLIKGQPMGSYWGLTYLGTWKASEADLAAKYGAVPGDARYQDLDNNFLINPKDFHVIGTGLPRITVGWNNTFTYDKFSLNIFTQGLMGFDKLNYTYAVSVTANSDAREATIADIRDRYITGKNETSDIPGFSKTNKNYVQSTRFLEKGDFIRVKNVSLSYTIPKNKTKFSDIKVFVSGTNLFTFTKYNGIDPEATNITSSTDVNQSVDYGSYPNSKIYTVGVNFKF